MDINGLPDTSGFPLEGFPLITPATGLGIELMGGEAAMGDFSEMTEDEKEHFILSYKDAPSEKERQKLIDSIESNTNRHQW